MRHKDGDLVPAHQVAILPTERKVPEYMDRKPQGFGIGCFLWILGTAALIYELLKAGH